MGPKQRYSNVLTNDEERVVVEFRRRTLLPLDDCLYALQATTPHLSKSNLVERIRWRLHEAVTRNHGCAELTDVVDFVER